MDHDGRLRARHAPALARVQRAPDAWLAPLGFVAQAFDTAIVVTFAVLFSFEYGSPTRWALIIVVVEAALRWGLVGGIVLPLALIPFLWFAEHWRATRFGPPGFLADRVSFPAGIFLISGMIVGWLVARLREAAAVGRGAGGRGRGAPRPARAPRRRARRGQPLRPGALVVARARPGLRRVHPRAGGLLDYDRVAIVLAEAGSARVMAAAGKGTDAVFPPGSRQPIEGSIL